MEIELRERPKPRMWSKAERFGIVAETAQTETTVARVARTLGIFGLSSGDLLRHLLVQDRNHRRQLRAAERVMQSWVGRDLTEAGRELLILRWAVSNADRETVERYGGLNAALKKINQLKQATPEPQGLGMIDDIHLWGQGGAVVCMRH